MQVMDKINATSPVSDIERSLVAEFQKLDLTPNEARILVYLMTHGHSSASDISRYTNIQRTETYNYLSGLLTKGIIFSTFDRPQKYYAMPLEEVVDCLLQSKKNELEAFEGKKTEYISMFNTLVSNKVIKHEDKQRYNVVIGENAINAKITRMLSNAKEDVSVLLTDKNMVSLYHAGITDHMIELTTKGVHVKLITPYKNLDEYIPDHKTQLSYDIARKSIPVSFVLVDGREIIVLLEGSSTKKSDLCAFYTNNLSLLSVFKFLFEAVL